jgi:hypothetical protein
MPGGSFYEGKASDEERAGRFEERFKEIFVAMDKARGA